MVEGSRHRDGMSTLRGARAGRKGQRVPGGVPACGRPRVESVYGTAYCGESRVARARPRHRTRLGGVPSASPASGPCGSTRFPAGPRAEKYMSVRRSFVEASVGDFLYTPDGREWQALRASKLPDLGAPLATKPAVDTHMSLSRRRRLRQAARGDRRRAAQAHGELTDRGEEPPAVAWRRSAAAPAGGAAAGVPKPAERSPISSCTYELGGAALTSASADFRSRAIAMSPIVTIPTTAPSPSTTGRRRMALSRMSVTASSTLAMDEMVVRSRLQMSPTVTAAGSPGGRRPPLGLPAHTFSALPTGGAVLRDARPDRLVQSPATGAALEAPRSPRPAHGPACRGDRRGHPARPLPRCHGSARLRAHR
jgi:hypothetical protein